MKKLLLCLAAAGLFINVNAQVDAYHAGNTYTYLGGSNNNFLGGFPTQGEGSINIYYNTYNGKDTKGPFAFTTAFYSDLWLANGSQGNNFSLSGTAPGNAVNIATITYYSEVQGTFLGTIEVAQAQNITLNMNGGRTFITPLPLIVPDGVKVYEYDSYSDGTITFTQSLSGIIPSYTPVYIVGEGERVFEFVGGVDSNANLFQGKTITNGNRVYFPDIIVDDTYCGVLNPHKIPTGSYILQDGEFKPVPETMVNPVIEPYNCYIKVSDTPAQITIELKTEDVEAGYYLGGELTAEFDDDPNPSYMFTKTEEGTYTLEVASIPKGTTFYVIYYDGKGNLTYYSSNSAADKDLEPGNPLNLEQGRNNTIGLGSAQNTPAGYLNVTFTLTLDESIPSTISYTGTLEQSEFYLTVGNDKTTQSGTITDDEIVMQTEKDNATVFIYVPEGAVDVQYALDNVTEINVTPEEETGEEETDEEEANSLSTYADDVPENLEWENATPSNFESGAYEANLPTGTTGTTGTLYVRYTYNDETETSDAYTFTVTRSVPTAVESINAEQEDGAIYNVFGQKVDENYKGIVIKNGKKYIQR